MRWLRLLRRPTFLIAVGVLVVIGGVWTVTAVSAAQPRTLDDRTLEVARQLQCPVCTGESVADSPSLAAADMRRLIRQQLAEGKSEQQVIEYFRTVYGDTILESPPKSGFTSLIWLTPLLMLLAGGVVVWTLAREWRAQASETQTTPRERGATNESLPVPFDGPFDEPLAEDERRALRAILLRELAAEEGLPLREGTEGV